MNRMELELLAADAVRLTLEARDGLPKALNGRPIAPSNEHAVRIRKEMQQGQSKEFLRVATVSHTDLEDGVSYEIVRRPLMLLDASLAARAGYSTQPMKTLSVAEQRADAALDMDQLLLPEREQDPAFLARMIERCAHDIHATQQLKRAAELALARHRGSANAEPTARLHPMRARALA